MYTMVDISLAGRKQKRQLHLPIFWFSSHYEDKIKPVLKITRDSVILGVKVDLRRDHFKKNKEGFELLSTLGANGGGVSHSGSEVGEAAPELAFEILVHMAQVKKLAKDAFEADKIAHRRFRDKTHKGRDDYC